MGRLSRLVRVKQLSLGPDLFLITGTRHRPLLFTTTKPNTLSRLRRGQILVSAISSDGRLVEVATEEGEQRPRSSGVEYLDREKRRTLPEELLRNVVVLTCKTVGGGTCDVYLVGTNHVSQESCKEVQAVISHLRPQAVFMELCASRVEHLRPMSLKDLKVPSMSAMIGQWNKKQNPFGIMLSYLCAHAAAEHKVIPCSEFRVGYEEAKKWGSKVILGDRPYNVTLARAWASWGKLSLCHKTKMLSSLLRGASIDKAFPALTETITDERDQYMSSTLLAVARQHRSVVAILGKGHLPGIKKYWEQPVEMEKLMEIPSTSGNISNRKIVKSLGVAAVGVAIVAGAYLAART